MVDYKKYIEKRSTNILSSDCWEWQRAINVNGLTDVDWLGYEHRHLFHFKIAIEVFDDDRELEFILVKRKLESFYVGSGPVEFYDMSCEHIGIDLAEWIMEEWPGRNIMVDVSEDGENGFMGTWER